MNLGNYNGRHTSVLLGHRLPVFSMLHTPYSMMKLNRFVVHMFISDGELNKL